MSISADNEHQSETPVSKSRLGNLIRQYAGQMVGLKLKDRCRTSQVHALNPPPPETSTAAAPSTKLIHHLRHHQDDHNHHHPTINSILLGSSEANSVSPASNYNPLLPFGLPTTDHLEPPIEINLKSVDYIESMAGLYRRLENSSRYEKSAVFVEQYSLLCGLGDPKLLRRCLQSARQHAVDVCSKVVLAAWLRYERREDELIGKSSMDCIGRVLECPRAALVYGYEPRSISDRCHCSGPENNTPDTDTSTGHDPSSSENDGDVWFSVGDDDEINCSRHRIAALSAPLESMLYGNFMESQTNRIDFSQIGISAEGMRALERFSRLKRLNSSSPNRTLELLSFANRFCCNELKSACDEKLASIVSDIEEALILIDYGLEERSILLVSSCLQIILRELPNSMHKRKVLSLFCTSEALERLTMVVENNALFFLYYFLTEVAFEQKMKSNITVMLLERLRECSKQRWQKALSNHRLGCVWLEKKEFKTAQFYFEAAAEEGHVYSLAGAARAKFKQGQRFSAHELINSIIAKNKPTAGWMYQERSLHNFGKNKVSDLENATKFDPALEFPYKYRAVSMAVEEKKIDEAIVEISRIIGFKVSPGCLEIRAWLFLAMEDYEGAMRDIQALLTLECNYMMFNGKMRGDRMVEILGGRVRTWSPAECWMQLYDQWSTIDDVGSLGVVHKMVMCDPGSSVLLFRQSLLLLRLNCQKAAMRSLRLAHNHAKSDHERLVYQGWILYDTGHREEALSKAEESLSIQRSFEAFFLKAYALADTNLDPQSASYVIQLLEEALKCPSDGLRKGQALNNLGSVYVDCGKVDLAADCYQNALAIKHTRAHQGLARVYHLKNERKAAYEEMTKLIDKAQNKGSAYEKRSEYCDRDMANDDLSRATESDPLRTYPYRYRAAVLMDDQREDEAIEELSKAISFKPDLQMLNLRAAFHESIGDFVSALRDCEAALCLDPNHKDTLDMYIRTQDHTSHVQK